MFAVVAHSTFPATPLLFSIMELVLLVSWLWLDVNSWHMMWHFSSYLISQFCIRNYPYFNVFILQQRRKITCLTPVQDTVESPGRNVPSCAPIASLKHRGWLLLRRNPRGGHLSDCVLPSNTPDFCHFLAEFRHQMRCQHSKREVRSRCQCTEVSVLMICKWFRLEFRRESSMGSLRNGEVLNTSGIFIVWFWANFGAAAWNIEGLASWHNQ